jgi:hypothetical protein
MAHDRGPASHRAVQGVGDAPIDRLKRHPLQSNRYEQYAEQEGDRRKPAKPASRRFHRGCRSMRSSLRHDVGGDVETLPN